MGLKQTHHSLQPHSSHPPSPTHSARPCVGHKYLHTAIVFVASNLSLSSSLSLSVHLSSPALCTRPRPDVYACVYRVGVRVCVCRTWVLIKPPHLGIEPPSSVYGLHGLQAPFCTRSHLGSRRPPTTVAALLVAGLLLDCCWLLLLAAGCWLLLHACPTLELPAHPSSHPRLPSRAHSLTLASSRPLSPLLSSPLLPSSTL
ncbi:hypothetical protein B0J11DRAFT_20339 [Dendryphion nanum]|uniref:Uncharacterized protein n=1 Tax=Dendryphion nanum TaxID=256645 RepID=A0A9P9EK57_9PLEO|nr:hypothetical protein B0J11DRAFT_20339 [Dendryphion nanum]